MNSIIKVQMGSIMMVKAQIGLIMRVGAQIGPIMMSIMMVYIGDQS